MRRMGGVTRKDVRENSSAINRTRAEEEYLNRDAQVQNRVMISASAGHAADRPSSDYLLRRGSGAHIYFATDTFVLSVWTGTAWKSVTLS